MTVEETIKGIVAKQLKVSNESITGTSHLMKDLGADSLDVVEIMIAVEDEFGPEIDNETGKQLLIVQSMIDFVNSHNSSKQVN